MEYKEDRAARFLGVLATRVILYDGAMGTRIQRYDLQTADFGGPEYAGCNDYLAITRPDVIAEIHRSYLAAGADVIETDTFRSNRITLAEYKLADRTIELNEKAVRLARSVAAGFTTPDKPRFVAGSIGPTGKLPSSTDPVLSNSTVYGRSGYQENLYPNSLVSINVAGWNKGVYQNSKEKRIICSPLFQTENSAIEASKHK